MHSKQLLSSILISWWWTDNCQVPPIATTATVTDNEIEGAETSQAAVVTNDVGKYEVGIAFLDHDNTIHILNKTNSTKLCGLLFIGIIKNMH